MITVYIPVEFYILEHLTLPPAGVDEWGDGEASTPEGPVEKMDKEHKESKYCIGEPPVRVSTKGQEEDNGEMCNISDMEHRSRTRSMSRRKEDTSIPEPVRGSVTSPTSSAGSLEDDVHTSTTRSRPRRKAAQNAEVVRQNLGGRNGKRTRSRESSGGSSTTSSWSSVMNRRGSSNSSSRGSAEGLAEVLEALGNCKKSKLPSKGETRPKRNKPEEKIGAGASKKQEAANNAIAKAQSGGDAKKVAVAVVPHLETEMEALVPGPMTTESLVEDSEEDLDLAVKTRTKVEKDSDAEVLQAAEKEEAVDRTVGTE